MNNLSPEFFVHVKDLYGSLKKTIVNLKKTKKGCTLRKILLSLRLAKEI